MTITQTNRDQEFRDGALVAERVVEVDVTAGVVEWTLHQRARDALTATPDDRIAALEAQVATLTRLVIGRDLLLDT